MGVYPRYITDGRDVSAINDMRIRIQVKAFKFECDVFSINVFVFFVMYLSLQEGDKCFYNVFVSHVMYLLCVQW